IDKSAFTCANLGPNVVKLTATDGSLNSASADATVTVHDVTAPSVVAKNIDVNLDATGHATIVAADVDGGTTDACGPISLSIDKSAFTCANLGPNTVKLTATDGSLNSASADATVTVHDVTSPVTPTIPTASGQCSVTVTAPTTTDTCAGTVTGTTSDPLTYNTQGTRVIHWTFSDGHGNTTTANQTVIVKDTTPPIVLCKDITVHLDGTGQCAITASSVDGGCSDNCTPTGSLVLSINKSTFNCSNLGANTVTLTARDANGNSNSGNATVTVVDDAAPTITCPPDMTVTDGGAAMAPITYPAPTVSDNCTVTSVSCVPASGSNFPVGTTTVNITAKDEAGNTASCSFTVTRSAACLYSFNGFLPPIGGADAT